MLDGEGYCVSLEAVMPMLLSTIASVLVISTDSMLSSFSVTGFSLGLFLSSNY